MNAGLDAQDVDDVLRRYLEIQGEEQRLKEEKARLQDRLAEHMKALRKNQWCPDIDGKSLKVRFSESTVVDYNEELLRQRLADRYVSILEPDVRKIRRAIADVAPLLQPIIEQIGSPSPDRVRSAIEAGVVQKEEFTGAFEKTTKRMVAVSKARQNRDTGVTATP